MKIVIGIVMLALLAATACDDAVMTLEGPDTVAQDEEAWYDVTITGLTPIGVVNYYPFIDLNDDELIDENEWIGGFMRTEFVNSEGVSTRTFLLEPDDFFESRELEVPDATTVYVYAEFYVSPDNIYAIGTVSKDLEITEEEE